MKPLVLIVLCIFLFQLYCCDKDSNIKTICIVNVKFLDDEDYVGMETVDGEWNSNTGIAKINAVAYNLSRFKMYLSSLHDTGFYPFPTIDNIYFTDGADFQPTKLADGYIHLLHIDSHIVRGDFQVSLQDDFNGAETRTIIGNFGIINK